MSTANFGRGSFLNIGLLFHTTFLVTATYIVFCCYCEAGFRDKCHQQSVSVQQPTYRYTDHDAFMRRDTEVITLPGHWPSGYCLLTNVFLRPSLKTFYVGLGNLAEIDRCYGTQDIWKFALKLSSDIVCDQVYDVGHAFTMYYYHKSNYFHFHLDTILPLYNSLWWSKLEKRPNEALSNARRNCNVKNTKHTVLMPAVEIDRGKGINWDTDAFFNDSSYWNQLLQAVAQPYQLLPLDARLAAIDKTLCFKEILFGTPKINVSNATMIRNFAEFIRMSLNITSANNTKRNTTKRLMGLIKRTGRRKILNDNQLVEALRSFLDVELIDFIEHSLKDQIEKMQKYDILAGINGAGLINAIYLPAKSVAIQMIPFEPEHLNHAEYRTLLEARGPYLEWQNNHSELNRFQLGKFHKNADTIVQVEEFVNLIKRALKLLD